MEESEPTMADELCSNPNDTCATLNRCPDLVESLGTDRIPETCGFDTKQSLLMVCCPTEAVKEVAEQLVQKPRFFSRRSSCSKTNLANISGFQRRTEEQGSVKTEASFAADGRRKVAD